MNYLLLSILFSVTVGVLLKLAKRYQINILQAITWNYLFAIGLSFFFFKPDLGVSLPYIATPIYVVLGLLLPIIFLVQGKAVQLTGLARTDIAQRLSLFISLCAAYFIFNETFDRLKYTGLFLGLIAIVFTMYRKADGKSSKYGWLYLLLVFVGFGAIDVLFKLVSQISIIPYTSSLFLIFCIAFLLSLSYTLYVVFKKKEKLQLINFACGGILGCFNFGNILCYLKAHRLMSNDPSTVFAMMNIGVIILGSLIGIIVFKERLSKLNYFGLILALLAIIAITLAKLHAV